jgi:hypothetical protein
MCYIKERYSFVARFHVLAETRIKMVVFCDVEPCRLVDIDRRFREAYWLHHQGQSMYRLSKRIVLNLISKRRL